MLPGGGPLLLSQPLTVAWALSILEHGPQSLRWIAAGRLARLGPGLRLNVRAPVRRQRHWLAHGSASSGAASP